MMKRRKDKHKMRWNNLILSRYISSNLETNESETRRSGMERARRGRKYVQFRERWKYPRFHHSGNEDRNAFSSFSFSLFFFLDTACLNRDGTNLIGKSSGFPNPGIFREQIQLDVDRSNSKLLPFSLSATGFYPAREGRRRRRKRRIDGGGENLHLSKSKSS